MGSSGIPFDDDDEVYFVGVSTTVTDVESVQMLELGMVAFDRGFGEVSSFESIIVPEDLDDVAEGAYPELMSHWRQSGLWDELVRVTDLGTAEKWSPGAVGARACRWFDRVVGTDWSTPMVGSSVHLTRQTLATQMPELAQRFDVRSIDAASFLLVAEECYQMPVNLQRAQPGVVHRACDEVRDAVEAIGASLGAVVLAHAEDIYPVGGDIGDVATRSITTTPEGR
ncbi:oligoribonuclease-like protein [Sarcoptes scabiei]|uniref:Oligoribonuclease-like protein n=1 Tax=Sarcoptes scabiei TaxID=52283 RepID=A0A132A4M6_SARSC|nr:oligoribonuclease-like protein [Sarcoptes scabiei]